MDDYLDAISPDLCWEFGPAVAGKKHCLVVTSESRQELRPLVQAILKAEPANSRFEFYPYLLPEDLEQTERNMKGRTGRENISGIGYEITPGRFNTFDLLYHLPWDGDESDLLDDAFVLTETLLGGERLDKWVGVIETRKNVAPRRRAKHGLAVKSKGLPIAGLRADFEGRIGAVKAALRPYRELVGSKQAKWGVLEMKPNKAPDYARKDDLRVSPCVDAELFNATLLGGFGFYSERFSKDETFVYLKMDGTAEDLDQEIFNDRGDIQDALEAALKAAGLGCMLGGGTGWRYSYVDLALTDLKAAIPLVRRTLQAGKLTRRSWLLFQDADLQSEWIGIWDDSPPPPRAVG